MLATLTFAVAIGLVPREAQAAPVNSLPLHLDNQVTVNGSIIPPAGKSLDCKGTTGQVRSNLGVKLNVPTTPGTGGACNFSVKLSQRRGELYSSCAGRVKLSDMVESIDFGRGSLVNGQERAATAGHFFNSQALGLTINGGSANAQIHITGEQ